MRPPIDRQGRSVATSSGRSTFFTSGSNCHPQPISARIRSLLLAHPARGLPVVIWLRLHLRRRPRSTLTNLASRPIRIVSSILPHCRLRPNSSHCIDGESESGSGSEAPHTPSPNLPSLPNLPSFPCVVSFVLPPSFGCAFLHIISSVSVRSQSPLVNEFLDQLHTIALDTFARNGRDA